MLADKGGAADGQLSREELERKLEETGERLKRYRGYQEYIERNLLSQISLTDADARLIKGKKRIHGGIQCADGSRFRNASDR